MSVKRLAIQINSAKEDMHLDTQLLDLQEPVIIHIFSYLDYNCLCHVVSKVSMECQRLAHSRVLWSQASLSFYDCWYGSQPSPEDYLRAKTFVRDILETPYLYQLTVSLKHDRRYKLYYSLSLTINTLHVP